jgi:hypothetical protein
MRAKISVADWLFLDRAGLKGECYFNLAASFDGTCFDVAFLRGKGPRLGINSAYFSCSTFSQPLRHPYHYLVTRLLYPKDSLHIT